MNEKIKHKIFEIDIVRFDFETPTIKDGRTFYIENIGYLYLDYQQLRQFINDTFSFKYDDDSQINTIYEIVDLINLKDFTKKYHLLIQIELDDFIDDNIKSIKNHIEADLLL